MAVTPRPAAFDQALREVALRRHLVGIDGLSVGHVHAVLIEDFAGPQKETTPLTPRERYAQVLLVSNELFFVD